MTTHASTAAALADAHDASEHARQVRNHADHARRMIAHAAAGMSSTPAEYEHIATAASQLEIIAGTTADAAGFYAETARTTPNLRDMYTDKTTRATHRTAQLENAAQHLARAAEAIYFSTYYLEP